MSPVGRISIALLGMGLALALAFRARLFLGTLLAVPMEVVFASPQTLAVVLDTTSAYNLTVLRTTVEMVPPGYASAAPVHVIERTVEPPYSAGSIDAIESAWWQLEWEGAQGMMLSVERPVIDRRIRSTVFGLVTTW
jgi:hypothetical protein